MDVVQMFPEASAWGTADVWMSLLMLTFMEIVLGIDNIIFISIAANRLPESKQARARNIGLALAMIFRVILLFGISLLIAMQEPWFELFGYGFSGQSVILIAGGLFLLYKSTTEIHHKLEGDYGDGNKDEEKTTVAASLTNVIIQISLINLVFSVDSIITAVGLADYVFIMIIAVVISVVIMMVFAGPVGRFVNKHPTVQMLGLSFLILIGFMLITEGLHFAHVIEGAIPKGYLYFAIFFSLMVEFLNMSLRKKSTPKSKVKLNSYTNDAINEGIIK